MSTPVAPAEFDSKAFIAQRNASDALKLQGKAPAEPAPAASGAPTPGQPGSEPPPEPAQPGGPSPRLSRSQRRVENQLRRENGELAGRLSVLEKMLSPGHAAAPQASTKPPEDPEPQRSAFTDDAAYQRALGRWDARQEVKTAVETVEGKAKAEAEQAAYVAQVQAMDAKCREDIKEIEDWDEAAQRCMDDEDYPEFALNDHPTLAGLLATSEQQARVLRFWADNPKDLQRILELTATPAQQIRAFARLEGKVESLYPPKQKAAQATEAVKPPEDRTHPAEAPKDAGRTATEAIRHPRPSTEVAARGGAPAPPEPAIGSREWMEQRNRSQFGR